MSLYGTYYHCGCWHQGDPSLHPHTCPSHGKLWKARYEKEEPMNFIRYQGKLISGIASGPIRKDDLMFDFETDQEVHTTVSELLRPFIGKHIVLEVRLVEVADGLDG